MKTIRLMLVAALLLFPTIGCLWSLHPLHTGEDAVFEPGLVGVWAATDGEIVAIVKESDAKAYEITYLETDSSKASPGKYRGRLVRLGDTLFLDLEADREALEQARADGLLATHLFFRIRLSEDELQVEMVDDELLKEVDPAKLRREKLPERYVTLLTAPSDEIRAWLKENAQNPQLYSDPLVLRRVK
ncbi:MAG: hypothetical protein ACRD4U_09855 [Candidatus Acidiferrales bacterium]